MKNIPKIQVVGVSVETPTETLINDALLVKTTGDAVAGGAPVTDLVLHGAANTLQTMYTGFHAAPLVVYPNPANNMVQVIYTDNSKVQEITLCDVLGNEVINTKETAIDVSNLQEGVYFISVKTNEGIATKKVIVQR